MRIMPLSSIYRNYSFRSSTNNQTKLAFPLINKYNIEPQNVRIKSTNNIYIDETEKSLLIEKILEAHELAQKNRNWGNVTKSGYATNIGLENGLWHVATNFNNTRNEISAICGERSAILGAYNSLLKSKQIENAQNKQLDFKVKYVAMSSYKPIGTNKYDSASCSDCLSWFNTTRYFSDDTIIASFEKDEQSNTLYLKLSKLSEYLPLRKETMEASNIDIAGLPIKSSKNAIEAIKEKGVSKEKIKNLIDKTFQEYKKNTQAKVSGQNIVAGILSNEEFFFGRKTDFSKRWYVEPLQIATVKATEKFEDNTNIDAICYIGDSTVTDKHGISHNDGVVSIKSLGAIRDRFANKNTLVITNNREAIEIRTIEDYMPSEHKFVQNYKR